MMHKKKSIVRIVGMLGKGFFVFVLSVLILYAVAYGTIWKNYQNAPADRYYWGNEEYPLDMAGNLAHVREGFNGHWQVFIKFSSTLPDQKFLAKTEYILMGKLARLTRVDPLMAFYALRMAISLLYLWTIYFVITRIFKRWFEQGVGIILALFSTSVVIPGIENVFTSRAVHDVLVFSRTTVTTHHYMLGGAMTLLSLYFLSRVLVNSANRKAFLFAVISGCIGSQVYAPDMVIVYSSLPLVWIVTVLRSVRKNKTFQVGISWGGILFSYTVLSSIPILYLALVRMIQRQGGAVGSDMEKLNPFSVSGVEYLWGVGLIYLFAILALPSLVRKGQPLLLLLGSWVIVHPIGEFFLSKYLDFNYIRYFLTPYFAVFGIVATTVIVKFPRIVMIILVIGILGSSIYAYKESQRRLTVCFCYRWGFEYGYPKRDLMQAIVWLRDNTTEDDIILSDTFAGNLIPAFAGNRVYTSWWYRLSLSPQFNNVMYLVRMFYSQEMTQAWAFDFLHNNHIAYVLYGDYERGYNLTGADLMYASLVPAYHTSNTVIYKVKSQ